MRLLPREARASHGTNADVSAPMLLYVLPDQVGVLVALTEEEERELSDIGGRLLGGCDDWYDRRRATFLIDKREGRFDEAARTTTPEERNRDR